MLCFLLLRQYEINRVTFAFLRERHIRPHNMIRILIADDHAIVREGLKQIVAQTTDIVVAGEASNAAQALEMARKLPLDLLLLDISMPGRSGLDVLVEVKRELPQLPVLILSLHPEDQY